MKQLVILTRGLSHTLLGLIPTYHEQAELAFDFSPESTQMSAVALTGNKTRVICSKKTGIPFSHAVRMALSLRPGRYHTVYVHGVNSGSMLPALIGATNAGIPQVVAYAHSGIEPVSRLPGRCFKKAVSTDERLNKLMFNGCASIIPDGIIPGYCLNEQLRKAYRAALGLSEKHVYLQISPFLKQGNYDLTLNIFRKIYELDKDACLICVGQGPIRSEILARVEYENLSDSVSLPGDTDNIAPFLMAADALLMPDEGTQGAALIPAAQAAGLPCLIGEKTDFSSALVDEGIYPLQTVINDEFLINYSSAYNKQEKLDILYNWEKRRNLSNIAIERAEETCRTATAIRHKLSELALNQ